MIKKIETIKNFGSFRNWKWNESLPDFDEKNLFYGWNGSGKTYLSRVFAMLSEGALNLKGHKSVPKGGDIEIVVSIKEEGGTKQRKITEKDEWKGARLNIHILNKDFTQRSFRGDNELEGVVILGEENIKLADELAVLRKRKGDIKELITQGKENLSSATKGMEQRLTELGRDIRKKIGSEKPSDYYGPTIEKIIKNDMANPNNHTLSDDDLHQETNRLKEGAKKDVRFLALSNLGEWMTKVVSEAQSLMEMEVVRANIEWMNKDFETWVGQGHEIHKNDKYKTQCQFCRRAFDEEWKALRDKYEAFFNEQTGDIASKIDNLVERIEQQEALKIPSRNDFEERFYDELRDRLRTSLNELEVQRQGFEADKASVVQALKDKKKNLETNTWTTGLLTNELDKAARSIDGIEKQINDLIRENNKITESHTKIQVESEGRIAYHWIANYVSSGEQKTLEDKIASKANELQGLGKELRDCEEQIGKRENLIEDKQVAAGVLEKTWRDILGDDNFSVQASEEGKFNISRSGHSTIHLSEGERTALCLAYFLTKLQDGKGKNDKNYLKDAIVFIDDPISSLDDKNLYSIYSHVVGRLDKCLQLFVSTHNFEFFNLLKANDYKDKRWKKYYIEKHLSASSMNGDSVAQSRIAKLPYLMSKYRSEYHYYFFLLFEFVRKRKTEKDWTEKELNFRAHQVPNLARRFAERFCGSLLPNGRSLNKEDLEKLLGENGKINGLLRFLHINSHMGSMERERNFPHWGAKDCMDFVKLILNGIEKEHPKYWSEILKGCKPIDENSSLKSELNDYEERLPNPRPTDGQQS